MENKVIIQVTPQRRGYNFYLHPKSRQLLESIDGADPSRSNIFIGLDTKRQFEEFALDSVENQVVILLTGLTPDRLLQEVDAVEFQRMPSGDTTHTLQA